MRLCVSLFRGAAAPLGCVIFSVSVEIAACTHSALREKSHTRAYTAKHGAFWVGALSLPSERSARFGNPAWPGLKTANFAAFGSWSGGALEERREPAWPGGRAANFAAFGSWSDALLKNAESLLNSDALMRVAVPRRRGPAGLRNLFSFLSKLRFSHSVLKAFRVCET